MCYAAVFPFFTPFSRQMGEYEADSSYFDQDSTKYNLRLLHVHGDTSDFNKYLATAFSLLHICTHSSLRSNQTRPVKRNFLNLQKLYKATT
jgi:hypothetical protein